jgi:hypothetical protein
MDRGNGGALWQSAGRRELVNATELGDFRGDCWQAGKAWSVLGCSAEEQRGVSVLYIDKEATIVSRESRSNRYAAAGGAGPAKLQGSHGEARLPFPLSRIITVSTCRRRPCRARRIFPLALGAYSSRSNMTIVAPWTPYECDAQIPTSSVHLRGYRNLWPATMSTVRSCSDCARERGQCASNPMSAASC